MNYISGLTSFSARVFNPTEHYFHENRDKTITAIAMAALSFAYALGYSMDTNGQTLPWSVGGIIVGFCCGAMRDIWLSYIRDDVVLHRQTLHTKLMEAADSRYLSPVDALIRKHRISIDTLNEAMLEAVRANNSNAVPAFMSTHKITDETFETALAIADNEAVVKMLMDPKRIIKDKSLNNKLANTGNVEIVKILKGTKRIKDENLNDKLVTAVLHGEEDIAALLIDMDQITDDTLNEVMAIVAARNGNWGPITALIPGRVRDVTFRHMVAEAAASGQSEFVRLVGGSVDNHMFNMMLKEAAGGGRLEVVNLLIDIGRGEDRAVGEAFCSAASNNHLDVMKALIDTHRVPAVYFVYAFSAARLKSHFDAMLVVLANFPREGINFYVSFYAPAELYESLVDASKKGRFDLVIELMKREEIANALIYEFLEDAYRKGLFADVDGFIDTLQYRKGLLEYVIQRAKTKGHLKNEEGKSFFNINGSLALVQEMRLGKKASTRTMIKTLLGYEGQLEKCTVLNADEILALRKEELFSKGGRK